MKRLLFIVLLTPILLIGQTKKIGIEAGYGTTEFNRNGSGFMLLGVSYNFTPENAPFYFYVGTNISLNSDYSFYYSRLRIPIGFNFNIGRKVKFILGGGLFPNCVVAHNLPENSSIEKIYRFQIGAAGQIGISVSITPFIDLTLSFQKNQDLSPIFLAPIYSPGGVSYQEKTYSTDQFLKLGVQFPLGKQ